jgi:hypothetical protein
MFSGELRGQALVRPFLGWELTSDDGRVDFVAVDQALRGRPVALNKYEMDEVCRALAGLSSTYHGKQLLTPMRPEDESSPFAILKALLVEAYGPEFETRYMRYRNKTNLRKKRVAAKAAAAAG